MKTNNSAENKNSLLKVQLQKKEKKDEENKNTFFLSLLSDYIKQELYLKSELKNETRFYLLELLKTTG